MELEVFMLSKNKSDADKHCVFSLTCGILEGKNISKGGTPESVAGGKRRVIRGGDGWLPRQAGGQWSPSGDPQVDQ